MIRLATGLVAGMAAIVAFPVILLVASPPPAAHATSDAALREIPGTYRALYQHAAAERCPLLPWSVLAGVGKVETGHGSTGDAQLTSEGDVVPPIVGPVLDGTKGTRQVLDTDGGRFDEDRVFDRAVGPMQFLPGTWHGYGVDASGDGVADPHNAVDAIHSAAIYLCEHGASQRDGLHGALLAYNRSSEYVDAVLFHASRYGWRGAGLSAATPDLIAAVLANPRLSIYEAGRADIAAGRIDARVLALLQLASERHTLTVTSLQTGHSRCVGGGNYPGCRESHHWHGRGVDIAVVDGVAVTRSNGSARQLAVWLGDLPRELAPSEIGTPWYDLAREPTFFTDDAHQYHLHVGFSP